MGKVVKYLIFTTNYIKNFIIIYLFLTQYISM